MATVPGTKWTWAKTVTVDNPYQGTPIITFVQENMASFNDGTTVVLGNAGSVTQQMADATTVFNLLDPISGNVVGTATYGQVYSMMFSLYESLIPAPTSAIPSGGLPTGVV